MYGSNDSIRVVKDGGSEICGGSTAVGYVSIFQMGSCAVGIPFSGTDGDGSMALGRSFEGHRFQNDVSFVGSVEVHASGSMLRNDSIA